MIKKYIHIFLFAVSIFLLGTKATYAQYHFGEEFITVWKTDNPGASTNEQIYFPGIGTNYTIVWEKLNGGTVTNTGTITDATSSIGNPYLLDFRATGGVTSTTGAGTYRIKVSPGSGTFTGFTLDDQGLAGAKVDPKKLIEVNQWGTIEWTYLERAFYKASNMKIIRRIAQYYNMPPPNLTGVTSLFGMFDGASSFNYFIADWDVSNVTNMGMLFSGATSFNQPLDNWDVSNVTNMYAIFSGAISFNQPLDNWNVGKVTNIELGFANTTSFNRSLHTWKFPPNTNSANVWHGTSGMTMATWDRTFIGWANASPKNINVTLGSQPFYYCVAEQERLNSGVNIQSAIRGCPSITTPSGTNRRPTITVTPFNSDTKSYGDSTWWDYVWFRVTDASGSVIIDQRRQPSNTQLEFSYTPIRDLVFGQYKAELIANHFGKNYILAESTGTIEGEGIVTSTPPTCTTATTTSITNYDASANYEFNPNTPGITINPTTGLISGLTLGLNYTVTVTQGGTSNSHTFINQPSIQSMLPAAQTGNDTMPFCGRNNPTVADLLERYRYTHIVGTSYGMEFYANSSGTGEALAINTPLTNNTTYYAFSTSGTCKKYYFQVTVSLNTPAPPTGDTTQTFCATDNPKIKNLVVSGDNVKWYANANGIPTSHSGTELLGNHPLVDGVTYYALSRKALGNRYEYKDIVCGSLEFLPVTVRITTIASPTGSTSQTFCTTDSPTVANLVASGTNVQWYSNATGIGTPLASTAALTNGTTYYAFSTSGTCKSKDNLRVTVTLTTPITPKGSITQTFCTTDSPTVASLEATGSNVQWYTNATGTGTPLASTTALINGATYYAFSTLGTCKSVNKLAVVVTLTTPATPTGSTSQTFCTTDSPTVASLVATGSNVQWYSNPTGTGEALANTTALTNGTTYYAFSTLGTCKSANKLTVVATLTTPATPTGSTSQTFCTTDSPTVASLVASGSNVQWYSNPAGTGTPLATTDALTNGTTYYAFSTSDTCKSTDKLTVAVTVTGRPSIPTGSATQTFCTSDNPTVASLEATGTNVQWYTNATGTGEALANTTALTNGSTYYGFSTAGTCKSADKLTVAVTVTATPSTPTGNTTQTFCTSDNPTIANLVASGTNVQWYTNATGTGTALASTDALTSGSTYYGFSTAGTCKSADKLTVTVTLGTTPTVPAQSFCGTATGADLKPALSPTTKWYSDAGLTNELTATTILTSANYYVTTGCNTTGIPVAITVNENLVITGDNSLFVDTTTKLNTTIAGGNWTSTATNIATVDNAGNVTANNNNIAGQTTITYTVNNCSVEYLVTVKQNTGDDIPIKKPEKVLVAITTPNPTICSGTSTDITVKITGGTPNYTITYPGGTATVSSTATGSAIPTATYTFSTGVLTTNTVYDNTNVQVVDAKSCIVDYQQTATVTVTNCASTEYTISSETICEGDSATLTLAGSETGVTYQLQNATTNQNIGTAVNGTGNPINFTVTPTTTTTYKIIATKGSVTKEFTSKALVTVNPLPVASSVSVSGSDFCSGSTAIFTINGTANDKVSYKLNGGTTETVATIGAGGKVDVTVTNATSNQTIALTKLANANCEVALSSISYTINVTTPPTTTYQLTASDVCSGTNATLTLSGSESGVSYQLQTVSPVANVGTSVSGTGNAITLTAPNVATETTYQVVATQGTCSVTLPSTAIVRIIPIPSSIALNDENLNICKEPSRNINLNEYIAYTPQAGQNIQWKKDGVNVIGNTFNTGSLSEDNVTKFEYTVTEIICGQPVTGNAYLYIKAFEDEQQLFQDKDYECCESDALNLNLNQILGQQATGTWEFITPAGLTPAQKAMYLTNGHYFNGAAALNAGIGVNPTTLKGVYEFRLTITTATGCLPVGTKAKVRIVVEPDD